MFYRDICFNNCPFLGKHLDELLTEFAILLKIISEGPICEKYGFKESIKIIVIYSFATSVKMDDMDSWQKHTTKVRHQTESTPIIFFFQ